MEAAKAAIQSHLSSSGKHRTDVDEAVNPGVISQTIKPHRHEEHTTAVDREVHQHHYHTTVQPIQHQEKLPEKHTHNLVPVEHREIRHENDEDTKQRVAAELGRFRDTSTTHETRHTQAAAPTVQGEHVHHHVHETVQPVIHKETIQPEVVHTTVPIHETHHIESKHHGLSALPMKTLDEFKSAGGVLTGSRSHSHEEYDGHPRPYNDKLSTTFDKLGMVGAGGKGTTGAQHRHNDSGIGGMDTNHSIGGNAGNTVGTEHYSKHQSSHAPDTGRAGTLEGRNTTGTTDTTGQKPSMMDRLNPLKNTPSS